VWAKARVIANTTRIVAIANIPAESLFSATRSALKAARIRCWMRPRRANLDEVIGYLPKSVLRAEFPIRRNQLAPPPDVAKGELVDVQVFAERRPFWW